MDALIAAMWTMIPTQYLPYVTAAVSIGAALCMITPPPTTTGWMATPAYKFVYEVLQWCGLNKLHATNASYPGSKT